MTKRRKSRWSLDIAMTQKVFLALALLSFGDDSIFSFFRLYSSESFLRSFFCISHVHVAT